MNRQLCEGMIVTGLAVCILVGLAVTVDASGSRSKSKSKPRSQPKQSAAAEYYEQGMDAVRAEDYRKALTLFAKADRLKPNNPDTLNMRAYTNRKLSKLDEAFGLYHRALRLRPRFPEAREYLGEAHVHAALEQIDILRSYGDGGKEALNELIEVFQTAAASLEDGPNEPTDPKQKRW